METILKQFEQADQFLTCQELLQRWEKVPPYVLEDAVYGGMLVPLRFTGGPGAPRIEKAKLPMREDETGYLLVAADAAEELGIMFSLANVLLLENRFPHVFPAGQMRKKKHNEPMDVIMALLEQLETAKLEAEANRGKFESLAEEHMKTIHDLYSCERHIESLQSWVKRMRRALTSSRDGESVQLCDGQGYARWLCERRRANIPDAETAAFLHKKLKFSQAAAAFLVKTQDEFNKELDMAKKDAPIPDENRRGLYVSLLKGTNRARKKKMLEGQQNFSEEDDDEDFI